MTTTIFSGQSAAIEHPEELLLVFKSAEKPREAWRIGTEHEKIGFNLQTGQPLPYEGERGIRQLLEQIAKRFDWAPVWEGNNPIALLRGQASITLEPGGQLELSGAPLQNTHETCKELHQHLFEVRSISEEFGIGWFGFGRNPSIPSEKMPWMPKERYQIMRRYLPTRGKMALDMMLGTATVQTNLDYENEADMARKFRVALTFAPVITAMFANSPLVAGQPTGYLSTRAHVWAHTDPDRCGIPQFVFREDFSYQDYVNYALDVPMFFIHREGHYLEYAGRSFREFVERGMDGHVATQEDWVLHLTTIFPEVRVKNIIELRMADVGPAPFICALAALSRGLLYDNTALNDADALARKFPVEARNGLRDTILKEGLQAQVGHQPMKAWAHDLLDIAASGLKRLQAKDQNGDDEVKYLLPLRQVVETGVTQAEVLLETWQDDWAKDLARLIGSDWQIA